jgi:hypothetical protein
MTDVIDATDFGVEPGGADCSLAALRALAHCRAREADTLVFPRGTYHFHPECASEETYFVSNNTPGRKRIALHLKGHGDLTIDGQGSTFIFHGQMVPFVLDRTRAVTIKNLAIDWEHPLHAQGLITKVGRDYVDIEVDRESDFYLRNGELRFGAEGWECGLHNVLIVEPETGAPVYRSGDNFCNGWHGNPWRVAQVSARVVRLVGAFSVPPETGQAVVFQLAGRYAPGIFLTDARDTVIEDVTVRHCGAMACIAQKCTHVTLRRFKVVPRSGRCFSSGADASHFVYCKGRVELDQCRFENELDDPINVHGIYVTIEKRCDDATLLVKLNHHEQTGVDVFTPGERVGFVRRTSLHTYATAEVREVQRINPSYLLVTFDTLPDELGRHDALENLDWSPDVHIHGCVFRRNRARGILVTSAGKVVIEENEMSSAGAAILITSDANSWFESGAVEDVTIRRNEFRDCLYGAEGWGPAIITIRPQIHRSEGCMHGNIVVEANRFETFDTPLLYARSVDGLTFRDNVVVKTDTYPAWRRSQTQAVVTEECERVDIGH